MTHARALAVADELRALLPNSHAPHSGVHVAAAVETPDGELHFGVNVENAAFPEGVCAEGSAISAAVTAGQTAIHRVFLASSLPGFIWPCGGCRQKILEFAQDGCEVVSVDAANGVEVHTIEELLPFGFRLRAGEGR